MGRQIGKGLPRPQATRIRRVLIAFLAALYLVVGFAGEISCAEESFIQSTPISTSAASVKTDEDSKKTPEVVEHCYTCAPLTIPVGLQISEPVSAPIGLSFAIQTITVVDRLLLDPPPPKPQA